MDREDIASPHEKRGSRLGRLNPDPSHCCPVNVQRAGRMIFRGDRQLPVAPSGGNGNLDGIPRVETERDLGYTHGFCTPMQDNILAPRQRFRPRRTDLKQHDDRLVGIRARWSELPEPGLRPVKARGIRVKLRVSRLPSPPYSRQACESVLRTI